MAGYNTIRYEKDMEEPHIAYIILNRPEKYNAVNIGPQKMTGELQDAIRQADGDDDIKVLVFKGAGENFCVGADLSEVYGVYGGALGSRPYQSTRLRIDEEQIFGFAKAIFNCKKVTIAQIQGGWCVEAGIWIAECCDIAITANTARFSHRGQRLAFGGMTAPFELISANTKKQVELIITGRAISGDEAEAMGIVTRSVEPNILESEVRNLAKAISLIPLDAICMGKMCRRHAYDLLGVNSWMNPVVYHTLATNIVYRDEEKTAIFIRERDKVGEKKAFHKLHDSMDAALNKTKYFKSYTGK